MMGKIIPLAVASFYFFMAVGHAATEVKAKAITDKFDRANQLWLGEMKVAQLKGESVEALQKKRPDALPYAQKLKILISRDLKKEWTLKYATWLLENDTAITARSQRALLSAVEKHHKASAEVGSFCVAMIYLNQRGEPAKAGKIPVRTRGMMLLRQIKKENPYPKVQGQASLALSIMLSSLGDNAKLMKERIGNLREAIIKSADVKVGNITVADIVGEELYKINNLSKSRKAPAILGRNASGLPMELAQYRGKVVYLIFWSSWDKEASKLLAVLRKKQNEYIGKNVEIIGVNRDSYKNLRTLKADELVTWKNFSDPQQKIAKQYRISSWPFCFVLDSKGVIAYRGGVSPFADAVINDLLNPAK